MADRAPGRTLRCAVALAAVAALVFAPATAATAATGAPATGQPPKLDVQAAIRAMSAAPVYRAPGAVATYDERRVDTALGSDLKLLVAPFTGTYQPGHNYPTIEDYVNQVDIPLSDWAYGHHVKLVEVRGLYVRALDAGTFGPSDIPELRTQTAYLDVTSSLLGMINNLRTGADHYDGPPAEPLVAPTPAQLAAVTGPLRATPVYNAPGRDNPINLRIDLITKKTGFTVRVAAFPPVPRGQPLVNYAPALAAAFPGDEVFVSYGQWMEVAGPHGSALESARDYAYGRYEDATLEQGSDMADRIGTILLRAYDLVREHPFSRPQPTPYDLQHRISSIAPWVLLGSALLLGGGSLVAWQRRRAAAAHARRTQLRRESALATAAIAALGVRMLHSDHVGTEVASAAAERRATAAALFDHARTADAMRRVRAVAEEGEEVLDR